MFTAQQLMNGIREMAGRAAESLTKAALREREGNPIAALKYIKDYARQLAAIDRMTASLARIA